MSQSSSSCVLAFMACPSIVREKVNCNCVYILMLQTNGGGEIDEEESSIGQVDDESAWPRRWDREMRKVS